MISPLMRLRQRFRRLLSRLFKGLATQADLDRLYDQISGLLTVHSALAGHGVLKPFRGWAVSPDAMAWFLADLHERPDPTVLEFGSGQSTVVIAACLKRKGAGRLISVEHDPVYAEGIRRQLRAFGSESFVDLRVLPMERQPASGAVAGCESYGLGLLPEIPVDLGLVDGPPRTFGATSRYHPLLWAARRLNPGGALYLDDAAREGEQVALRELQNAVPDLVIEDLPAEKGLARLVFRSQTGSPPSRP